MDTYDTCYKADISHNDYGYNNVLFYREIYSIYVQEICGSTPVHQMLREFTLKI